MNFCMGCFEELKAGVASCPLCGFDESTYEQSGHRLPLRTVLYGKYMVGRVLGEGGFGLTYMGIELNLGIRMAIKEYYPVGMVTREQTQGYSVISLAGDARTMFETGRDRFLDEARRLARFRSLPGIVSVNDFFLENGTAYIAMDYIAGTTFKAFLAESGGKLPDSKVYDMMKPLMTSLAEVHSGGIIHRDISPDNIMFDSKGQVQLIDFGAARDFAQENKSLSVVLKPGFAPPEQYSSKGKQGPWTDVYALCATMYRAIAGSVPPEAVDRIIEDSIEPMSALGVTTDPAREAVIMKGLAVRVEDRLQSMGELREGLFDAPAAPVATVPVTPAVVAAPAPVVPEPEAVVSIERQPEPTPPTLPTPAQRKKPPLAIWLGGAAAAIAAVAIVIVFLIGNGDPDYAPYAGHDRPGDAATHGTETHGTTDPSGTGEGTATTEAPPHQEWINRDFFNMQITDAQLAEMVASGEIPANVTGLSLWDNYITDLTPLAGLHYLRSLSVDNNQITDLTPLANMHSLTWLGLSMNAIHDVSPLAGLHNLNGLQLRDNQVSDVTPLGGLANLQRLNLEGNNITDTTPLHGLTGLRQLELFDNPNVTPEAITALRHALPHTHVNQFVALDPPFPEWGWWTVERMDIPGLTQFGFVTDWFDISFDVPEHWHHTTAGRYEHIFRLTGEGAGNVASLVSHGGSVGWMGEEHVHEAVADVEFHFRHHGGRFGITPDENGRFNIDHRSFGTWAFDNTFMEIWIALDAQDNIIGFVVLQYRFTEGSALCNLSVPPELPYVQADFMNRGITDEQLAQMVRSGEIPANVTHLWLHQNEISDLSPLRALTNLQVLSLGVNQIVDLTPLRGLVHLQTLHLGDNQITDLSPIGGLLHLRTLSIGGNRVEDLSPLRGLVNLEWLEATFNRISDVSPLYMLRNLRLLELMHNPDITDEMIERLQQILHTTDVNRLGWQHEPEPLQLLEPAFTPPPLPFAQPHVVAQPHADVHANVSITLNQIVFAQNDPIIVTIHGTTQEMLNFAWVGIFEENAPEYDIYEDIWAFINTVGVQEHMFSAPDVQGNYEMRFFGPGGVLIIPFTVTAPQAAQITTPTGPDYAQGGRTHIEDSIYMRLNRTAFGPGEQITITLYGITQELARGAWVGLFAVDAPHSHWGNWSWQNVNEEGTVTIQLSVPNALGNFEVRLFRNQGTTAASFMGSVPFDVVAG